MRKSSSQLLFSFAGCEILDAMILIALGANLPSRYGDPAATIRAAIDALYDNGLGILAVSRIWLTAPVPVSNQPWYHNAVVQVETSLDPYQLLSLLHQVEDGFGRVRTERNAPRILDLDLVAYNADIVDRPSLIVPHPRMHERAFVLLPISDIAPNWVHPITGKTIDQMRAAIPPEQQAVPYVE